MRQRLPGPLEGITVTSILSAPTPPKESGTVYERRRQYQDRVDGVRAHIASSRLISIFWNPS